jgi:holliday junction resolvase Hjr
VSRYRAGRDFEYKVRDNLTADGYEVIRAAGSKGPVDLVAFKGGMQRGTWHSQLLFIQAKRRDGTISPADRAELLRVAGIVNAYPIVAHQPIPRRPIRYRQLTGPGPKQWLEWFPDEVAP